MFSKDKFISIYYLIDGILQGIGHREDITRPVSHNEIILTVIVSSNWR